MAIGSLVCPVSVTKNQKQSFSNIFKSMRISATQIITHHSVNFNLIQKRFKMIAFNNWIVSEKFKIIYSISGLAGRRD